MISLADAALIFFLCYLTNTSSAIGAWVAGIVLPSQNESVQFINRIDEEIDRNIAEAAIDILKDPKINGILSIDFKSVINSVQRFFRPIKNAANHQKPQNDIIKDSV